MFREEGREAAADGWGAYDDRDGVIWYDATRCRADARLHMLTHALHYASAVFEGERAYGGEVFKLDEHTQALFGSAATMGIEMPYSQDEINDATGCC